MAVTHQVRIALLILLAYLAQGAAAGGSATGTLVVRCVAPNGDFVVTPVLVDGVDHGLCPQWLTLATGRHVIESEDQQDTVLVSADSTTAVRLAVAGHVDCPHCPPDTTDFLRLEPGPSALADHFQQPAFPKAVPEHVSDAKLMLQMFVDTVAVVRSYRFVKVTSGPSRTLSTDSALFHEEVEKVITSWRFKPGLCFGRPHCVWIELPVNFKRED